MGMDEGHVATIHSARVTGEERVARDRDIWSCVLELDLSGFKGQDSEE